MVQITVEQKNTIKKYAKRTLVVGVLGVTTLGAIWGIGGSKASEHALSHANLTKNQVSYIRYEFDFDDLIPTYEVSWYQNGRESEYTVHALTGQLFIDD